MERDEYMRESGKNKERNQVSLVVVLLFAQPSALDTVAAVELGDTAIAAS